MSAERFDKLLNDEIAKLEQFLDGNVMEELDNFRIMETHYEMKWFLGRVRLNDEQLKRLRYAADLCEQLVQRLELLQEMVRKERRRRRLGDGGPETVL